MDGWTRRGPTARGARRRACRRRRASSARRPARTGRGRACHRRRVDLGPSGPSARRDAPSRPQTSRRPARSTTEKRTRMKLTKRVRDVRTINMLLTGAEAEARRAGESLPGAEHLLLSAIALPDGSARRAFERVGADPDRLQAAIAAQHADAL